jgi:uncharacterized Ntn-hydrolase superfamily protein
MTEPSIRPAALRMATFSIVGHDPSNGDWGVAVASKFPAAGALVPWARAGVGAIATQAWANVEYGPSGLALLAEGRSGEETVRTLVDADEGRDQRQLGVVDSHGRAATYTGSECMSWAGGTTGEGFACQGNILAGAGVVDAMAGAFAGTAGDLVDRLLAALEAGDAAGGDRRGRQSAAILVVREGGGYDGRNDRYVDLRVDDHPDPLVELRRVFTVFDHEYLVRNDPLLPAATALVEEVQLRLRATGHHQGAISGTLDEETRSALQSFAGQLNLERRLRSDDLLSEALVREIRDLTPELGW